MVSFWRSASECPRNLQFMFYSEELILVRNLPLI
jgi:hypothetical protein